MMRCWGGGGWGIFGLLGGTEEVQYQCVCRLLSLSFTSLCFCGGRRSLCYSVSSGSWLKSWKTKCRFVGTDHKHIPYSSLSVLSFESRFFLVATIQHVSSSCWLTCIYKVHICVHMCNTRYLSNLLLWLLLMMILVPSWRFQPVLFLLVLISCWWLVLRELKKGRRRLLWLFTISFISGVCRHFNEALFFYYSHCTVVTLILIICFFVVFF